MHNDRTVSFCFFLFLLLLRQNARTRAHCLARVWRSTVTQLRKRESFYSLRTDTPIHRQAISEKKTQRNNGLNRHDEIVQKKMLLRSSFTF